MGCYQTHQITEGWIRLGVIKLQHEFQGKGIIDLELLPLMSLLASPIISFHFLWPHIIWTCPISMACWWCHQKTPSAWLKKWVWPLPSCHAKSDISVQQSHSDHIHFFLSSIVPGWWCLLFILLIALGQELLHSAQGDNAKLVLLWDLHYWHPDVLTMSWCWPLCTCACVAMVLS